VRLSGRLRWGFVLVAMAAPVLWLAPGCGARTNLGEVGGGGSDSVGGGGGHGHGGAEPDATPDTALPDTLPDVPIDVGIDVSVDVAVDVAVDVSIDVVIDVPVDVSVDVPIDVPVDVSVDVPIDVPVDVSVDVPIDVPVDVPIDVPIDVLSDAPCQDADGDGYPTCENDCDDANPLVNPGAFDFPNGIDDDCNGGVDNPILDCGGGLQYTSQNPFDYAKAIDLCQTTSAMATGAAKTWGVIGAELRLADGSGAPSPQAHSIITSFGSVLGPRRNENFAFLSTGAAATPGQPYFVPGTPEPGTAMGVADVALPPGFPTNKQGCPLPENSQAHDSVNLKLTIRVPTNARSFGFDHGFFSAEYPEWACTQFNDLWVVLLKTGAPGIANNRDIVFDAQGTPGSVNLNFFDRCVAGQTGCSGGPPGFNFCSGGKSELANTGYGDPSAPCGQASSVGGGTGWLTTESPVLPGETVVVQFMVWDSSDAIFDSAAIFDNFRWQQGALPNPKTYRAP
jgi:Putative metal-binding motif